jgi:hypothetical protein
MFGKKASNGKVENQVKMKLCAAGILWAYQKLRTLEDDRNAPAFLI